MAALLKNTAVDVSLMKDGSYGLSGDVQDHVLFDSQQFQATTVRATTTFFSTPIGGAFGAGIKSNTETNMTDPGKLPASQTFLIKEIGFSFLPIIGPTDVDTATVINAYYNIMAFSTMEIKIAGREFDLQVPGSIFFPPVFAIGRGTIVQATDMQTRVGDYLASGWVKLATPIVLGELVSFNVTQRTGSAITANQTILNTASDTLATQAAQYQVRLKGTLSRSK